MLKRMGSFTKRASSTAVKSQFIVEVNKITFAESNEVVIGSDIQIGPDMEVVDGVSSTITTRGEVNFMKSFSLYVTLYRDKKDVVLEKLRKLFIKIRSPRDSSYKPFGFIQLDLAQYTSMNGPHNISVRVTDCIVVAAIVSLTVTYVTGFRDQMTSDTQHSAHSDQMVPDSQFNSSSSASASDQKVSSSANPPLILNVTNSIPSSSTLPESPNAPSPGDRIPSLERRNSIQRRASLRAQGSFRPIDEMEDEEDRSNRATKELVERIQKQNEEYKKTNQSLKAQLDSLTDQLIEVNLQRAELLTNIDHEVLEKRKLRERLQWYEWIDVWGYLWSQNPENGQIARASLPEPGTEELIDTE